MFQNFISTVKSFPRLKLVVICLAIWQYVSIVGMVVLGWSHVLVFINTALLVVFTLYAPVYEALLLFIISIPFFVVLPTQYSDTLSIWRPLLLLLLFTWLWKSRMIPRFGVRFMPWDKYLGYFFVVGICTTLLFAQFKYEGIKQALFFLNIYALYVVISATVKTRAQFTEIIRYLLWALTIIVTLGFTQLFGTFTTNLDTFWVYWAENISRLYYGNSFAQVALFSNSWFSYTGSRELRMFSIMPDSQSFAYMCIFGVCLGTALTKSVFIHVRKWLWSGIRFAALGLMLSGTRAVWVSMVVPFGIVLTSYLKKFNPKLSKKFLWPFVIVIILFVISPLINKALSYGRVGGRFQENFLTRAQSVYDIHEVSNQGRLIIWKQSSLYAIHHLQGVGFGNFIMSMQGSSEKNYDQISNEINTRYNLPQKYISAHNLYLQILVETGLLGLIFFIFYFFTIIKSLALFLKKYYTSDGFLIYFVAQVFLALVWICGAAFFDVTLLNDKVLMVFFIDIALAGFIIRQYEELDTHA